MSAEPAWEPLRHHPTLYSTARYGCWSACSCGWLSSHSTPGGFRTVVGAHLAFGVHLVEVTA